MVGGGDHLRSEPLSPDLLERVSRAFYLSIRVLPSGVRQPVSLAYLLARAADTIADTSALPPDMRLDRLVAFRRIVSHGCEPSALGDLTRSLADAQPADAERELLLSAGSVAAALKSLDVADRERVSAVVSTLCEGMEFDLARFPPEEERGLCWLDSGEELDRYAYLVAGCVGEFWTDMSMAHTPALRHWDRDAQAELGVAFGKALQMTNILRDVPSDLRSGRCYIPAAWLSEIGLHPLDLTDPTNSMAARPALARGVRMALGHFEAAEEYLLSIPRRCLRLRLAAAWPLLMGLATLDVLMRNPKWLDPSSRSKVSRRWVYRTVAASVPLARSNTALSAWVQRLRERVEAAPRRV